MEEFTKLVISFMGGGVIAGLISWARIARSERETRKSDYIKSQLDNLYGPIYYYTSQNNELFRLSEKIMGAYTEEYSGRKWSEEPTTQNNLKEETTQTIDISNRYIEIVTENNKKAVDIIQNNASFIDPEDNDIFQPHSENLGWLAPERDRLQWGFSHC